MESHTYTVNLSWKTSRIGEISSPELDQSIVVATPPEFPKGIPGIWSPEHLYTAAVSSCFMTTFLAIAENSNLSFVGLTCPAEGKLEKVEGKMAMTEILLKPVLLISDDEDLEKAEKILWKTERACLISNSITAKVHMEPLVVVVEPQEA